jgi:pimeloyl-ACP methyl ester carboxylesterase
VSKRILRSGLLVAIAVLAYVAVAERWPDGSGLPVMPKAAETGFAPVNGIRMYYAVYGEGAPILLIHGGLASADVWANQVLPLVAAGHRVIVADSRGHGRSSRDGTPIGYDLMASDYLALLDYLKLDKVAVVGWSDGGIIGLDLAIHHPERLTRLFAQGANVSVDGVTEIDEPEPPNPVMAWLEDQIDRITGSVSDDTFTREVVHMWETEPNWTASDLQAITVPTAIVTGDQDTEIRRDHVDYMAATIPGARLIVLPGVGHPAMVEDPATYTRAVLDFVDGT